MASNTEAMKRGNLEYIDKTEGETLDNKTLNKMAWRSMFLQASFNYERMQAGGWLYSILPGLKKIHKNKQDLSTSMKHNLEFFNCHPFLITFVMGIILSLEQKKADIQTIRSLRVAAMGPLGGIGDAIFWFTLLPISAGIGANLSLQGKNIKLCFTSYNENDCFLMASPIINIKRVINLEYNVVIRFLQGN